MIFKKRKRMVDVRELQRRGVVRLPKNNTKIPTDKEGFVELNSPNNQEPKTSIQTNTEFFGFMDTPSPPSNRLPTTDSPGGYNKQEVDTKTIDLDNKIYKLEQRIELLEKKLDVNQPSTTTLGPMGW